MLSFAYQQWPILLLLAAVTVVLRLLPKVDLGHSSAFRKRRTANWLPLGLTYALLYMGRYNLSALAKSLEEQGLLSKPEYGFIDGSGSLVYGLAFLLNGPLADKFGGRATILMAAGGSALMNAAMGGLFAYGGQFPHATLVTVLTVLFCFNMYFQSFGAVSIVKVNAPWFHVRERGVNGGIFGILISLGLYFSYDWSRIIAKAFGVSWAFIVPALILTIMAVVDSFLVKDTPHDAGFPDFDTGDATVEADAGKTESVIATYAKLLRNPVILTIVGIEFCSGFLRNAVMKWYLPYAGGVGESQGFVATNWGLLLCIAGILGGVFAGLVSDHVFGSRRGPVAAVLYGGLVIGALSMFLLLGTTGLGYSIVGMSLCVIGVHGMLSGTASADFGGKKNAGIATGFIDGFVYLGTALQSFVLGSVLPVGEAAKTAENWRVWPAILVVVGAVGLALSLKVWNARPRQSA